MSCRFYLNGLSLLHGVVIVPLDGWVLVRQPQDPKTWALWMSSRETIIIQQRTLYYPFGWLCSLAFVCRVGVKCIWGFRWRLPARLGLRRAFELSSLQFVLPAACCLPLFVSRPSSLPSPSSSQLAFVVRNLVFIGFLGLNFNLVLARKPDLCTSRCPPYSIHTYICTYARYARCAANKAIYTRHSLCAAPVLFRVGLFCRLHCHLGPASASSAFFAGSNCYLVGRPIEERIYQCANIRHAILLAFCSPHFHVIRQYSFPHCHPPHGGDKYSTWICVSSFRNCESFPPSFSMRFPI